MTRFKELRRIEQAIENNDRGDLDWALSYCQARLELATLKSHQKYWRQMLERVKSALAGEPR